MTPLLSEILAVATGGALGSLGRYGVEVSGWCADKNWATLAVNLAGCLLIGVIATVIAHLNAHSLWNRLLVTGLLGGFTTFSSFMFHPTQLMAQGRWMEMLVYVGVSVMGGLLLCFAGMWTTQKLIEL